MVITKNNVNKCTWDKIVSVIFEHYIDNNIIPNDFYFFKLLEVKIIGSNFYIKVELIDEELDCNIIDAEIEIKYLDFENETHIFNQLKRLCISGIVLNYFYDENRNKNPICIGSLSVYKKSMLEKHLKNNMKVVYNKLKKCNISNYMQTITELMMLERYCGTNFNINSDIKITKNFNTRLKETWYNTSIKLDVVGIGCYIFEGYYNLSDNGHLCLPKFKTFFETVHMSLFNKIVYDYSKFLHKIINDGFTIHNIKRR